MIRRSVWRVAAAAAAAALLAWTSPAAADYIDSQGNVVHWAGGNNIVVTDRYGNTVYRGPGVRQGDHLYAPGQTPASSVVTLTAPALGFGAPWGVRAYGGKTFASPYPGATQMADLQPIALDPQVAASLGLGLAPYAQVFRSAQDPRGYAAVPEGSKLGQFLAAHGFPVQGGWVVLHGQPGVSWEPLAGGAPGPSLSSVSQVDRSNLGGGIIHIDLAQICGSHGCAGGPWSEPLRLTSASVTPNPALAAEPVTLTATTQGPVRSVAVGIPWAGTTLLSPSGSVWTASFPAASQPGTFALHVVASGDGQADQRDLVLTVLPLAPRIAQVVAPTRSQFGENLAVRVTLQPTAGPVMRAALRVIDLRPVLPPMPAAGAPAPNPAYGKSVPFYAVSANWQPGTHVDGPKTSELLLAPQGDGSWQGHLVAGSWVDDAGTFAALEAGGTAFPFALVIHLEGPGGSDTRSLQGVLEGSAVHVLPQAG